MEQVSGSIGELLIPALLLLGIAAIYKPKTKQALTPILIILGILTLVFVVIFTGVARWGSLILGIIAFVWLLNKKPKNEKS